MSPRCACRTATAEQHDECTRHTDLSNRSRNIKARGICSHHSLYGADGGSLCKKVHRDAVMHVGSNGHHMLQDFEGGGKA